MSILFYVFAMDFIRLTKLMNLTTSNHDGEALTALRKANELILKNKDTWEGVLKVRLAGKPLREDSEEPKRTNKNTRDEHTKLMLEVCLKNVQGPFREFIESLADSYERFGSLTPKQFAALEKSYLRNKGKN